MSFHISNVPNQNPQRSVKLLGTDSSSNERTVTLSAPQNDASFTADVSLVVPPNDGTSGQVLTTDGAGVLSWGDNSIPVEIPTTTVVSASQTITLADPTNYIVTDTAAITFDLPATTTTGNTWYIGRNTTGTITINPGTNTLTSRVLSISITVPALVVTNGTSDIILNAAAAGKSVKIVALTSTTFLLEATQIA